MMRIQILILALLCYGIDATAQQAHLSREAYRDRVENYSQILKQQQLKSVASMEGRKIAFTGFLPQVDITGEGTLNLKEMDAWDGPAGQYRNHTYQGVFVVAQPLYTGGALRAQNKIAQADEKLDRLNAELTLDQIHYQSDAVYWNAAASRAMLEAAARYEEIVKQQFDIIQDRFNDGMISRTDLLMISTRKKEAELQYIKARQNYTLALQKLNILMGEDPNAPVDSLCAIGVICEPVTLMNLDDVLQRRADYASTEVNIQKKYNDFDVRQYGYSSLSTFIDEIDSFVLIKENNTVHVALKEDNDVKEKVVQFAKEYVKKAGKNGIYLGALGQKIHGKYPNFKVKEYGYSTLQKFISGINIFRIESDEDNRKVIFLKEK